METVQEMQAESAPKAKTETRVQSGAYLIELSLDWIVLRASENVHHLLGESHVTLIDEPLGRFVHSQPLHDLRNLFSRLSGTTGICRAYRIRLTDEPELFDIAFQQSGGRVILEAVPSASEGFGEAFGTVGGLIAGLSDNRGQALMDGGVRRMRALTGYDRVTLICGDQRSESSRGAFAGEGTAIDGLPPLIADAQEDCMGVFPWRTDDTSIGAALMLAPDADKLAQLRASGIRSTLRVMFALDGGHGEFRCDSRTPRPPSFELHAAAELFAQLFAMRLEIDRLKSN